MQVVKLFGPGDLRLVEVVASMLQLNTTEMLSSRR